MSIFYFIELLEEKVLIFNPTSREDMNNVMSLAEDKLVLGGFLFQEALSLAKQRKMAKPRSSGWYTYLWLNLNHTLTKQWTYQYYVEHDIDMLIALSISNVNSFEN